MQDNPELLRLFSDDQADRQGVAPADIFERDAARRERVEQLLADGALHSAADFLHAAFIFQHGTQLEHYWQAHELAMQAVALDHGHPARWLAAAAYDRWLMHQGQPQKFGTQYRWDASRWVLHEVEPTTTDAERASWDVPSLAEAMAHAERLNQRSVETPHPVGRAPADPPETIAVLELRALRVALVAIGAQEAMYAPDAMPLAEPLDPELPHPLPEYFPAQLTPHQLGAGYAALDLNDTLVFTWFPLHLPPGETMYLAWNAADGPAPALEYLNLDGQDAVYMSAAWSAVSLERLPILVLRAGLDSCWLVGGHLSREEMAKVAASLPRLDTTLLSDDE